MDIGNLLRFLDENTRSIVRSIEKTSYKVNNTLTSVDFNTTFIQNASYQNINTLASPTAKELLVLASIKANLSDMMVLMNKESSTEEHI